MKMRKLAVMAVAFVATLGVIGVVYAEQFLSPVVFKSDVDFDNNAVWKIGGVKVTATAANLNAGLASSTASLVSNAVLKVYGSNLVIKAGGTVTLPDASVASAALPATIANSTLVSNAVLKVYGSNLAIGAGGTGTVPSGSIDAAALTANVGIAQLTNGLTLGTYNVGTGATIRAKVISLITLTNVIYGAGATTANVNVVTWTP